MSFGFREVGAIWTYGWQNAVQPNEGVVSTGEPGESYCPECGQSLDLTRYQEAPVKRWTLEPFVFLIFGLCLTVVFGLRTWNSHSQLSSLDKQIAALRARQSALEVGDTMGELLTEQAALQVGLQRDLTGLGLGLFTTVVGAVNWLCERHEPVDERRRGTGFRGFLLPVRLQVGTGPWALGAVVAITMVRMGLMMFVTIIVPQLLHNVPPSLQLVDRALTRIAALVSTILAMGS